MVQVRERLLNQPKLKQDYMSLNWLTTPGVPMSLPIPSVTELSWMLEYSELSIVLISGVQHLSAFFCFFKEGSALSNVLDAPLLLSAG